MPSARREQSPPPAGRALELARQLLATDLAPEQRRLAEGIRDAAEAMLDGDGVARRQIQGSDADADADAGSHMRADDAGPAAAPAPAPHPRGRGRILVVDDSESNRLLALLQLDRLGFDAEAADDGWSALERLASEPFDLVLLDGMMPGLDGPATAREIRRREAGAELAPMPIVALTASILPEDRSMLLDAGIDDHLGKPIRIEELARVLDIQLAEHPSRPGRILPVLADQPARGLRRPPPDAVVDTVVFARLAELGDAQLAQRLIRLFLADATERVRQVDSALASRDTVRLRAALEALEGACGGVGALALLRRAHELHDVVVRMERMGPDGAPAASGLGEVLRATRAWFDRAMVPGATV